MYHVGVGADVEGIKQRRKYSNGYTKITHQFKLRSCPQNPFDIGMEDYMAIIEIDGRQHFEQVWNWNSPDETQETDASKMVNAKNESYSIIRISQEDIWNDTIDWRSELKHHIRKRDSPVFTYISSIERYGSLISKLEAMRL